MQSLSHREAAGVLAALGSEHRITIVELLQSGERCVCEITPQFRLDASVVSRHLAILEQAGIISSRRVGRRIFYRIADHRMLKLVATARLIAGHPDTGRPVGRPSRKAEEKC